MGYVTDVHVDLACPQCGTLCNKWQTRKWTDTNPITKDTLWMVDSFHGACDTCEHWIVWNVESDIEVTVKSQKIDVELCMPKDKYFNFGQWDEPDE